MRRLTLNVLLSFAQFEREVTGERIRDKIAASKAKGMWIGGNLALGYDVRDRQLLINEPEAETVRQIFSRYLQLGSVNALAEELDQQVVRTKIWMTRSGQEKGGFPFTRGSLFHLLKNPLYIGRIRHKDISYPGKHAAIIDVAVFEAVQAQLNANAVTHKSRPKRSDAVTLRGACPMRTVRR